MHVKYIIVKETSYISKKLLKVLFKIQQFEDRLSEIAIELIFWLTTNLKI